MSANANKELVEVFLSAMLTSDQSTMEACLAPDARWHPPAFIASRFGEVSGRDQVIAFLCDNPERYYVPGSRTMDLHALVADGDRVSAHFDLRARPVRGGELNTPANFMFRCGNDVILETWENPRHGRMDPGRAGCAGDVKERTSNGRWGRRELRASGMAWRGACEAERAVLVARKLPCPWTPDAVARPDGGRKFGIRP